VIRQRTIQVPEVIDAACKSATNIGFGNIVATCLNAFVNAIDASVCGIQEQIDNRGLESGGLGVVQLMLKCASGQS